MVPSVEDSVVGASVDGASVEGASVVVEGGEGGASVVVGGAC